MQTKTFFELLIATLARLFASIHCRISEYLSPKPRSTSSMIHKSIQTIDTIQDWFGFFVSMLIFPMVLVVLYEVMMRYIFGKPTSWGFELTTFIYGVHYMLGLGYTLMYNGHVKVDVFLNMLPKKKKHMVSFLTTLVFFIPVFFLLSIGTLQFAWTSIIQTEHSWTSWGPPIYPLKALMALGFVMLLIQGISSILKDIRELRSKGSGKE